MSEKKIQDYLHYYIGFEVIGKYCDEERKGYLTGVQNGGHECEIQFFEEDGFNVFEEPEFNETKDVKLCLFKLEDMSMEEYKELRLELSVSTINAIESGKLLYSDKPNHVLVLQNRVQTNTLLFNDGLALIKKGYWLFGDDWFDEGLVLDKKTLQS